MTKSIEIQILDKIRKAKRDSLFFVENFVRIAKAKTTNISFTSKFGG